MAKPKSPRARRPPFVLRVIRFHWRLAAAIVLAGAVTALLPSHWGFATRLLVGWDTGVVLYLVLVYSLIASASVEHIRAHAAREDEGRFAILVLTVLAALASLGAILAELSTSQGAERSPGQLALAAITIVLS
jgi:uncharacterized membrane protein